MDFKKLGADLGLDEEEFYELVELFVSTAFSDIEQLQTAYHNQDTALASEAAHSLRGAAGNLGFMEFSEVVRQAEENARNNRLDGLNEVIEDLTEKLKELSGKL